MIDNVVPHSLTIRYISGYRKGASAGEIDRLRRPLKGNCACERNLQERAAKPGRTG
ncbi:MAG: hypothetical protein KGR48_16475 [Alphaproteobacteria bacterium]|nr:hypothetical protein [Alphaproteobacteria bacterium]